MDIKNEIDSLVETKGLHLRLTNTATATKEVKKILKGGNYTYLPLGSGVKSPGIEVKGTRRFNRALTPDEVKKLYEQGPPIARPTTLSFSQWLASGIYQVPSQDKVHPEVMISREILIKRVANILGASHPIGTIEEEKEERENRFDPYILDLHQITLADGFPATYYQLLEIAKDILDTVKILFE